MLNEKQQQRKSVHLRERSEVSFIAQSLIQTNQEINNSSKKASIFQI